VPIDCRPVSRLALLALVAVIAAGCSDSVPGGKVVSATPVTVIGKVALPWTGGDAAAGDAVFHSAGCTACHTFTPAKADGKIGPDLDKLPMLDAQQKGGPLAEFIYGSITDPASRRVPGYPNGVMPATFAQSLSAKQLADVVAFLAKGP
jgi:cytochrome c551/c552